MNAVIQSDSYHIGIFFFNVIGVNFRVIIGALLDTFHALQLYKSKSFGLRQIFDPKDLNIRILTLNKCVCIHVSVKFDVTNKVIFVFLQNGYFEYIRLSYKKILVTHWIVLTLMIYFNQGLRSFYPRPNPMHQNRAIPEKFKLLLFII